MSDGYRIDPGPVYPRAVCIMGSRWYVKTGPGFRDWLENDGGGRMRFATREDAERQIEILRVAVKVLVQKTVDQLIETLGSAFGEDGMDGVVDEEMLRLAFGGGDRHAEEKKI